MTEETKKELTGYPSIDKPWEQFYAGIEKTNRFLETTPYIGLIENNKDYLEDIAIEYFGAKIKYGVLFQKIDEVSKALAEYGVKSGDFVTICSTTTPEVIYAFYAISKLGAVANVMAPFYTPEELLSRINECNSNLVIVADMFISKFRKALHDNDNTVVVLPLMNSSVLRFVSKKNPAKGSEISWKKFILDGMNHEKVKTQEYKPCSPMAMVYSSGTTGASKGILLSVDSFQKLINAYGNSGFDTSRGQTVFQNIPPWHSTGLSLGINFPLSYGVKVCTDPRFDHNVFIKSVLKFKPEYILTNTSMYQGFTFEKSLRRLKGKSLSFLRYPVEGGEPLTEKDINAIETVFRNHGSSARLLNGYGECECGATVTTDITSHKFSNEASGIPLPSITTIAVFDDDNNELKYKQKGNIYVNTEIGMLEYYNNKEATKDFFYVDSNGNKWGKTGDVGFINEDGSLVVLGRKSDYSVINGRKIFNFDVERAILKSDKVKLCEIQTHPEDDNRLVAHIVWENNMSEILQTQPERQNELLHELQAVIADNMGIEEAIPTSFCIWDSFPSAFSGKRDISFIKDMIKNMIVLEREKSQNYLER